MDPEINHWVPKKPANVTSSATINFSCWQVCQRLVQHGEKVSSGAQITDATATLQVPCFSDNKKPP